MFGQVDQRLRQVFPHQANVVLGGCSCLLFGDFGQLPPVMDLPLYTTVPRSALSDLAVLPTRVLTMLSFSIKSCVSVKILTKCCFEISRSASEMVE